MAKNLFIAATGKDVGKSTISFAMIHFLLAQNYKVGFMKPVGQRWLASPWGEVEEDVILMKQYFQFPDEPLDMNPIVIRKGYTESYLASIVKPNLDGKIIDAYTKIASGNDIVLIEGTGHAGVGAVLNKSNADVAKLLDAKVILLVGGGIGNSIDQLELNYSYFRCKDVSVIGIIVNKVAMEKYDKVKKAMTAYCKSKKIRLFGIIPYSPILSNPTLGQIIAELKPEIFFETNERNVVIDDFLVVASQVEEFIDYFSEKKGNQLLIMPSTRIDIAFAISSLKNVLDMKEKRLFTILFTGMSQPSERVVQSLRGEGINVLWKQGDTFSVISKLSKISIKTRTEDSFKTDEIVNLVSEKINYEQILNFLPNIPRIKKQKSIKSFFNWFRLL
jgi:BioD-like phosphotransacetylase family protein